VDFIHARTHTPIYLYIRNKYTIFIVLHAPARISLRHHHSISRIYRYLLLLYSSVDVRASQRRSCKLLYLLLLLFLSEYELLQGPIARFVQYAGALYTYWRGCTVRLAGRILLSNKRPLYFAGGPWPLDRGLCRKKKKNTRKNKKKEIKEYKNML